MDKCSCRRIAINDSHVPVHCRAHVARITAVKLSPAVQHVPAVRDIQTSTGRTFALIRAIPADGDPERRAVTAVNGLHGTLSRQSTARS